jgi:hypothetical protein
MRMSRTVNGLTAYALAAKASAITLATVRA